MRKFWFPFDKKEYVPKWAQAYPQIVLQGQRTSHIICVIVRLIAKLSMENLAKNIELLWRNRGK